MISTTTAYRATIGLIWALALWHSWECRGLFVDGSGFLIQIVESEWFFDFYPPRLYAMVVAQLPVMAAVLLGSTDLHLLARLLSLGLFGLPTLLYTLALMRARHDPVLLAVVIAAIGLVFMTTSFFIIGEYNSAYGIAILTAVRLATTDRLRLGEALVLAAIGALAIRTYEVMIYLGPLLASMIVWRVATLRPRPILPTIVYLAAAVFFLLGMAVAVNSVMHPHSEEHLEETWHTAKNFWQNMQFDLVLVAALIVVVWGIVKPIGLIKNKPYVWGGAFLAILAFSPLLALTDTLVRPLAKSQYVARTVSGLVISSMVVFVWAYRAEVHRRVKALLLLRTPPAAGRFLAFACLMLWVNVPSDLLLTAGWKNYLEAFRATIRSHSGVIAFEDTPLARRPYFLLVENWALSSQSLAMRASPDDGIVVPPRDFKAWVPFSPFELPNLGRFVWRD